MKLRKAISGKLPGSCAILNIVKQWTDCPDNAVEVPPPDDYSTTDLDSAIQCAIESQNRIGWPHFFRGSVSKAWDRLYPANTDSMTINHDMRAVSMLALLIQALQNYALDLWSSRNRVLYEVNNSCASIVHNSLNRDITQLLYDQKSTFSPVLQSYFTVPLDVRLASSPRQRKRWLRLARLATSHASAYGTSQQSITT